MSIKWRRKKGGGEYTCRSPHSKRYMIRRGNDDKWHIFEWNDLDSNWWEILGRETWLLKTAKGKVARLIARETA